MGFRFRSSSLNVFLTFLSMFEIWPNITTWRCIDFLEKVEFMAFIKAWLFLITNQYLSACSVVVSLFTISFTTETTLTTLQISTLTYLHWKDSFNTSFLVIPSFLSPILLTPDLHFYSQFYIYFIIFPTFFYLNNFKWGFSTCLVCWSSPKYWKIQG